jgi:hypothetical protein
VVSKAALERMVEAWRVEHPTIGFTRLIIGDCAGGDGPSLTGFPNEWDQEYLPEVYPKWIERNLMGGGLLDVEELIATVDHVLRLGGSATIPSVAILPRPPA